MTINGYHLGGDWSRHGTYANVLEDLTKQGAGLVPGEIEVGWGRSEARATVDSVTGTLKATINNHGRQFSYENTASPISGKVLPGTPIRLQKTDPANASIKTLFAGVLGNPDTTTRVFTIDAIDAWGIPGSESISTPVYSGQRTGFLINVVLDAVGWTGPRDIDPGATVVDWWWAESEDADTAVAKLVASEGTPAIALVEGGTFVFHDRHHRQLNPMSVTSQGTFTAIRPGGAPAPGGDHKILRGEWSHNPGLQFIANSATFTVDQRQPADLAPVWTTDTPITLAANETQALFISTSDPFINAVDPVPDVDYTLLAGSVTVTLDRTSGAAAILTLTAGGADTIIATLQVRANSLPVARSFKVTAEDAASVGSLGRQTWQGEVPWANRYDAKAIADRIVAVYALPRPTVTVTVANVNPATLTRILSTRVSDRVTIRIDEQGLNGDFYVETINHLIRDKLQVHTMTIGCSAVEPTRGTNEFTFGVAGKGFGDGVFAIEGLDVTATMFRFDVAGQGFGDGRFST